MQAKENILFDADRRDDYSRLSVVEAMSIREFSWGDPLVFPSRPGLSPGSRRWAPGISEGNAAGAYVRILMKRKRKITFNFGPGWG